MHINTQSMMSTLWDKILNRKGISSWNPTMLKFQGKQGRWLKMVGQDVKVKGISL